VTQRRPSQPGWRGAVDNVLATAGPVPRALADGWRRELDDVERRVLAAGRTGLRRPTNAMPVSAVRASVATVSELPASALDDGMHALVVLATARLGTVWAVDDLLDVACAVELADRATRHHDAVADRLEDPRVGFGRRRNVLAVLDGDLSITQAAVLVADVGSTAYRILVRGYGGAQVARLRGDLVAARVALLQAATSLGALVAGVPQIAVDALWRDARMGATPESPVPARVLGFMLDTVGAMRSTTRSMGSTASRAGAR
jgi:hypothetical protein